MANIVQQISRALLRAFASKTATQARRAASGSRLAPEIRLQPFRMSGNPATEQKRQLAIKQSWRTVTDELARDQRPR
jgi:hypothetical protein